MLSSRQTRWLVTGASGMLGRALCERLQDSGAHVSALDRGALDVTDARAVDEAVAAAHPDLVVNCAAMTAVDAAESAETAAHRVNADGPRLLARACADTGAHLVHISTDYVFDGGPADFGTPYPEDAVPRPRTAYGRTKLAGEQAALAQHPNGTAVLRTGWLYGHHGHSFVGTMVRRATEGRTVDVVNDQFGQPTWTSDLAERIVDVARTGATGVFHATSSGQVSWHGLATEVFRLTGADASLVRPIDSSRLSRPAPRPHWSVLAHDGWTRAGLAPLRDWRTALTQALSESDRWKPYS
ncbi:dTDP-4-dehydrorhamnose reductase [Streptomyces sp. NPDC007904]|uniref:dTDP-4-dehydrorhamnose reductase n=1 Tax=Streptomyces sp. NPDC007904 TaxID=3364787 RepID=UPI0036EB235C